MVVMAASGRRSPPRAGAGRSRTRPDEAKLLADACQKQGMNEPGGKTISWSDVPPSLGNRGERAPAALSSLMREHILPALEEAEEKLKISSDAASYSRCSPLPGPLSSCQHFLVFRVVERVFHDGSSIAFAEKLHLDPRAGNGIFDGQIAVQDALAQGVAVARAGDVPKHALAIQQWLAAQANGGEVVGDKRAELARVALRLNGFQRRSADEVAFAQLHREPKTCFVGIVFGVNVGAP